MKKYELMMIIDPTLVGDDQSALIAFIDKEIADVGGKITSREHPGEQKLAYRIHASQVGYYLLYTLEKEGDFVEISNAFNIKKDIWRYMFTRIEA